MLSDGTVNWRDEMLVADSDDGVANGMFGDEMGRGS